MGEKKKKKGGDLINHSIREVSYFRSKKGKSTTGEREGKEQPGRPRKSFWRPNEVSWLVARRSVQKKGGEALVTIFSVIVISAGCGEKGGGEGGREPGRFRNRPLSASQPHRRGEKKTFLAPEREKGKRGRAFLTFSPSLSFL